MFLSGRTLGGFWDAVFESPQCIRCKVRIHQYEIWDIDEKEECGKKECGKWAAIAQVFRKNKLSGGLLCGPCVMSFRQWVREGDDR